MRSAMSGREGCPLDIKRLHAHVEQEFSALRGPMDAVFDTMRDRVARGLQVSGRHLAYQLDRVCRRRNVRFFAKQTLRVESSLAGMFYYPDLTAFCYEPATPHTRPKIEVLMWYHPQHFRLPTKRMAWDYLQYRLYKIVHHELVHRAQFVIAGETRECTMTFEPHRYVSDFSKECQQYLGEMDEIEAYARDTVEEWYYINPTTPLTMRALMKEFVKTHRLATVHYYYLVFKGDINHLAVKRYLTKVMAWNVVMTPMSHTHKPAPTYLRKHRARRGSVFMHE